MTGDANGDNYGRKGADETESGRYTSVTFGSGLAVSDEELAGATEGTWSKAEYVAKRKLPG